MEELLDGVDELVLPVGGFFEVEVLEAGDAGAGDVEAEEFAGGEVAAVLEGGVMGVEGALGFDDEHGRDGRIITRRRKDAKGILRGFAALRVLLPLDNQKVGGVFADARPRAALGGGKAAVAANAEFGEGGVAVVVDFQIALGQFGAAKGFGEEFALEGAIGAVWEVVVGAIGGDAARPRGSETATVDTSEFGVAFGLGFGETVFEVRQRTGGFSRIPGGCCLVGLDDAAAFELVWDEITLGFFPRDVQRGDKAFDMKKARRLGNGFFLGGEAATGPEGGGGAGADGGLVVVGGKEDGTGSVGEGDGFVDFPQQVQFVGGGRGGVPEAETLLLEKVKPDAEGARGGVAADEAVEGGRAFRNAVGAEIVEGARGDFGATAHGGEVAKEGLEAGGGWVGVFKDFGTVGDAELIEGQAGKAKDGSAVEALDGDGGGGAALEFVECGVLLFLELVGELAAVAFVEDDDGFFGSAAVDFAETAAGGLQDHVAGAVAFLGEDDAGKGAAVPAFFADLDEEDDADGGMGGVEGGEGEVGAFGSGEVAVAAVVAEDGGDRVEAAFFAKADGKGENLLFEAGDGAAIDGEFGAGAGGVAFVTEAVEEFRDAALHDVEGVGSVADDLDDGFLEEGANAFDEGEVVDGVGNFGGFNVEALGNADFFRRGEVGRAGEAEDGTDGAGGGPFRDDAAEFDFGRGGMVGFIDEDGKGGKLGNRGTEFVGGGGLFIGGGFDEEGLLVVEAVEDDSFGVGDGDEAEEIVVGLQGGEFLNVGIADAVRTGRGGVGVQYDEFEGAAKSGGEGFGDDPGRVEGLDGAQAGDDGGFEAGGSEDEEVFREGGVVRLLLGEGEVEVEEGRHEEGFAGAHGEGEEVVGVGDAVEEVAEDGGGVNGGGVVFEAGAEGRGKDSGSVWARLGGELQERQGGGMGGQMVAGGLRNPERVGVEGVQKARGKDVVERAVATGDFEKQVCLDGFELHLPQSPLAAHVLELCAKRTIAATRPFGGLALQELVDHGKPLSPVCPKPSLLAMILQDACPMGCALTRCRRY